MQRSVHVLDCFEAEKLQKMIEEAQPPTGVVGGWALSFPSPPALRCYDLRVLEFFFLNFLKKGWVVLNS